MVNHNAIRGEVISTGKVAIPAGGQKEIIKTTGSEYQRFIRAIHAEGPRGMAIAVSDGDDDINAECQAVDDFPLDFKSHPVDLGKGSTIKIVISNSRQVPIYARAKVELIKKPAKAA